MEKETEDFIANNIKSKYEEHTTTDLENLKKLDKKVTKGANIFAYIYGIISTLIFGTGLCLAMKVIGDLMVLGIVVGVIGMAMMISTYYIYRAMVKKNKKKYGNQIIELSNKILNN